MKITSIWQVSIKDDIPPPLIPEASVDDEGENSPIVNIRNLNCDVLVGADGPRSIVAKSQGDVIGERIVSEYLNHPDWLVTREASETPGGEYEAKFCDLV